MGTHAILIVKVSLSKQSELFEVQRWIDAHAKYFQGPTTAQYPTNNTIPYVTHRTHGPTQVYYGFAEAVQCTPQVVQIPNTLQPPFRISPYQPTNL
ncbi:unnamed protein product [Leptidea sinapis]|uniref:Uncharacterized protein n=1 Tax=Leptidea sinapis TaxID=189913 RepID=A0A5E4R5A1_9NEOP|nr:unnamed protein product [Leptidea sinapis]